jgi:formylglycine-generating enzyme required for sulfatase activity
MVFVILCLLITARQQPRGSNRVLRGGSWNNNAQNCRSANRNNNTPANRNNNTGFRLVSSQPMSTSDDGL